MKLAKLLAAAVERALAADGTFVAINNTVSQSVPHLHVHVVPRFKRDGLFSRNYTWPRKPYNNPDQIAAVARSISATLSELI